MRYIIFSFIVLCVSFASAQGGSTPTYNPTAVAIVDRAESFANQYLGGVEGFDATDYVNELKDLVYTIDSKTDLSHFKVDKFMDGVEDNVDTMLKNFGKYEKVGTYKEDYLKQTAEFFIKEYCKDMEGGDITDIDTQTYIDDIERLNASFTNKLETLNAPESEGNVIGFDPDNYLDAATGNNQRAAKIEFYWAGVGDHWLGINLVTLIETFQKNFFHDSVAQVDFAYLKDLWPQSAEVYAMNAAYDPSIYDYEYENDYELYRAKQSGEFNNEYVIDEYGTAADADDYKDQLSSKGNKENIVITDTTEYFSGGYSTYNNRRWGYNYNNNTNTTIKLTTNGRTYSLQESVFTSPLIIDLDNDGAFEASKGMWLPHSYAGARLVEFDMDGDGFIDLTEWVGPNDGILMVRNAEVDANCFFGWAGGYAHGYEKLSLLDRNGDQQISGEELAGLCVWQDRNENAQIDDGEVLTVQEVGITSFSLRHDNELVSSCEMNGARVVVVDWHPSVFVVRKTR